MYRNFGYQVSTVKNQNLITVKYLYILNMTHYNICLRQETTELKSLTQWPNQGCLLVLGFEHMTLFVTQSLYHWATTTGSTSLQRFNAIS